MEITHSLSLSSSPSHPTDGGGSLFALPQQLFQESAVGVLGDISDLNGKKVEDEEGGGEDTDIAQLRSVSGVSGVSVQLRNSSNAMLRGPSQQVLPETLSSGASGEDDTMGDDSDSLKTQEKDGGESKEKRTFNIVPPLAVGKHSNGFRIRFTIPESHDPLREDAKDDYDFIGLYLISSSVRVKHFDLPVALSLCMTHLPSNIRFTLTPILRREIPSELISGRSHPNDCCRAIMQAATFGKTMEKRWQKSCQDPFAVSSTFPISRALTNCDLLQWVL